MVERGELILRKRDTFILDRSGCDVADDSLDGVEHKYEQEFVDDIMAGSFAVRQSKTLLGRSGDAMIHVLTNQTSQQTATIKPPVNEQRFTERAMSRLFCSDCSVHGTRSDS